MGFSLMFQIIFNSHRLPTNSLSLSLSLSRSLYAVCFDFPFLCLPLVCVLVSLEWKDEDDERKHWREESNRWPIWTKENSYQCDNKSHTPWHSGRHESYQVLLPLAISPKQINPISIVFISFVFSISTKFHFLSRFKAKKKEKKIGRSRRTFSLFRNGNRAEMIGTENFIFIFSVCVCLPPSVTLFLCSCVCVCFFASFRLFHCFASSLAFHSFRWVHK